MSRQFQIEKAVRSEVPLLVGLMGPSGGGKTFSALRIASGIQKIFPGEIIGIDTESNRMLHYADMFDFRHVQFTEPFGSLDYLEVLEFVQSKKPSVIIVDSASHEHEGPGGLLDLHEKELDRLAGNDYAKRQRMGMLAWQKPKSDRRKLINGLLQMNSNFIFCFRAKESSRPGKDAKGKSIIENFGFMPIAGSEFVFEMTINMLLLPHANGHPTWKSENRGESMMMKLPEQFRDIFKSDVQLNEDIGEQLAKWAKGDSKPVKAKTTTPAVKLEAKSKVRPEELDKLEDYLTDGLIQDKQVTLGKETVNLLEKAKGAIKYLRNLEVEFNSAVKGYKPITQIIELIEAEPKELDVSREKDQAPVSESDELDIF